MKPEAKELVEDNMEVVEASGDAERRKGMIGPDTVDVCGIKLRKPTAGTLGLMLDMKNEIIPECRKLKLVDGKPVAAKIPDDYVGPAQYERDDPQNMSFHVGAFVWIHSADQDAVRRAVWTGNTEVIQESVFAILDSLPLQSIGEVFESVQRLLTEAVLANDYQVEKEGGPPGHPKA